MLRRAAALLAALVVFATSVAVAAPAASAAPPNSCPHKQPCIIVTLTGAASGTKRFTPADFPDLAGQTTVQYRECADSCPSHRQTVTDSVPCGIPIRNLIPALGHHLTPEAVSQVTITSDTGGTADLYRRTHDLAANNDPSDGFPFIDTDAAGNLLYPVVYPVGGGTDCGTADAIGYVRPLRSATDTIYDNYFQTRSNGELDIQVNVADTVLTPTIQASQTSVKQGGNVSFTVLPDGAPAGTSYAWKVGNTPIGSGTRVAHRFTSIPGRYEVTVVATAPGASGQDAVNIQVGPRAAPKTGDRPGPGQGNGDQHNPVIGPNNGTGLNAGARPDGSSGPRGASTGDATNAAGRAEGGTRSPSATPTKTDAVPDQDGFVSIAGVLLNPTAAITVPQAQRRVGQPETAPAARVGVVSNGSIVFGASLGASVLVLLLLGVLGESRRPARGTRRRTHP